MGMEASFRIRSEERAVLAVGALEGECQHEFNTVLQYSCRFIWCEKVRRREGGRVEEIDYSRHIDLNNRFYRKPLTDPPPHVLPGLRRAVDLQALIEGIVISPEDPPVRCLLTASPVLERKQSVGRRSKESKANVCRLAVRDPSCGSPSLDAIFTCVSFCCFISSVNYTTIALGGAVKITLRQSPYYGS
jgi:hypothetical protein